jgi:hypothetical protein
MLRTNAFTKEADFEIEEAVDSSTRPILHSGD